VGQRIQGVVVRTEPSAAALDAVAEHYGFRLFELPGVNAWILDLAISGRPDRATVRAARAMAPGYVDAVRVLDGDEHDLEQLGWLHASAAVAGFLSEPVLGFISDDLILDFAAIARPGRIEVVADHVAPYLLRWDSGALTIQPYLQTAGAGAPRPPEELELIPAVSLMTAEPLPDGQYPLHGNVAAELQEFAPLATERIGGVGDTGGAGGAAGTGGAPKLLMSRGLDRSCWDPE
jgi:hypothetical protein